MTTRSFRWVDAAGIERTVTEEELRAQLGSGVIPRSSLVCEVPGDAWVHAEEIDGIAPPPSTAFVPPPPPFVEDVQRAFEGKLAPETAPPRKPPARVLAGGTLIGGMVPPPPPPPIARPAPSAPPRAMAGGTLVGLAPPPGGLPLSSPPPSYPPPPPRRRALLPIVIGAVGLVALIGVVGIVRSLLSSPSPAPSAKAPAAVDTPKPPAASVAPRATTAPPPVSSPPERVLACRVAKGPAKLALRASKDVPIELAGVPAKGTVALGFSADGRSPRGLTIDPQSLVAKLEPTPFVRGFLRHVTPVPTQTGARWLIDADLPKATVAPTLSVAVEPSYAVGIADGALVVVGAPGEAPRTLWTLPGTVDAMRALPLADAGALIAVRAEGGVYVGRVGTDRTARGALTLVSAPGQVGAPALGTNGVDVAIVFAWRAGGSDPWTLRLAHGSRSDAPAVASSFELPKGGPGGDAFAPSIAGLSDGRWLLAWTEGASGSRAVRATTLSSAGAPFGEPLLLSSGITSAGQGSIAVVGSDAGLAVFLTTTKLGTYDLWGTSLSCS